MRITHITRKISGNNYDNISVTAELAEGEDPVSCAVRLDGKAYEMLGKIKENEEIRRKKEESARELKHRLEQLLWRINNGEEVGDIPF